MHGTGRSGSALQPRTGAQRGSREGADRTGRRMQAPGGAPEPAARRARAPGGGRAGTAALQPRTGAQRRSRRGADRGGQAHACASVAPEP